jgi:mannose-6-phosphate isomerase-like protein (cupin superfamily)
MANDRTFDLSEFPVHLGLGATAVREERFTGAPDWYASYGARHAPDGAEGRLVAMHTFDGPWDSWEMHPNGDELVVCTAGEITLHREIDGTTTTVTLHAGEAVINPPGVWHTADVEGTATVLFITAGEGTEIRPR